MILVPYSLTVSSDSFIIPFKILKLDQISDTLLVSTYFKKFILHQQ